MRGEVSAPRPAAAGAPGYGRHQYGQVGRYDSRGQGGCRGPPRGRGGYRGGGRGFPREGRPHTGQESSFRSAVLSLRNAPDAQAAAVAAASLKAAILELESSGSAVDGALVGMAAAQASRLALGDLIDALCAFSWCRLKQFGGREVAELACAAVKHNCGDEKFFHFVGAFCRDNPSAFASLRDVSLLAASLLRRQGDSSSSRGPNDGPSMDFATTFHDLSVAALVHLRSGPSGQGQMCVRDVAEFLYATSHAVDRTSESNEMQLHKSEVCESVTSACVTVGRRCLHHATPQDIAKLTGAVAMVWPLMPQLQDGSLRPFVHDLAQAVRFRHRDLNAKDVAAIVLGFSKLDTADEVLAGILVDAVGMVGSQFTDRDLSLVVAACSQPGSMGKHLTKVVVVELQKRDLSRFQVPDLCIITQALAKLGPPIRASLNLLAREAFNRQLFGFSTTDKALLLWSLAKSRVVHMALARLLIRSLAAEGTGELPRDVASATLWAIAVIYPGLPETEQERWPRMLFDDLCNAQPWRGRMPFEVANAAWAFGQLPSEWSLEFWPGLSQCAKQLTLSELTTHELCNLLSGLESCPNPDEEVESITEAALDEVLRRVRNSGASAVSTHDKRSIRGMMVLAQAGGATSEKFEELLKLLRIPVPSVGNASEQDPTWRDDDNDDHAAVPFPEDQVPDYAISRALQAPRSRTGPSQNTRRSERLWTGASSSTPAASSGERPAAKRGQKTTINLSLCLPPAGAGGNDEARSPDHTPRHPGLHPPQQQQQQPQPMMMQQPQQFILVPTGIVRFHNVVPQRGITRFHNQPEVVHAASNEPTGCEAGQGCLASGHGHGQCPNVDATGTCTELQLDGEACAGSCVQSRADGDREGDSTHHGHNGSHDSKGYCPSMDAEGTCTKLQLDGQACGGHCVQSDGPGAGAVSSSAFVALPAFDEAEGAEPSFPSPRWRVLPE